MLVIIDKIMFPSLIKYENWELGGFVDGGAK